MPCAFSGSKASSQTLRLFFFLAATCDISLCILTGGLCVCTRGERQVHICSRAGTPPPRHLPPIPKWWRFLEISGITEELLPFRVLSECIFFCCTCVSSTLGKKGQGCRGRRGHPGRVNSGALGPREFPALTLISCGPATILSVLAPSSLTTKEPPHRLLYGLNESCGRA